MDIVLLIVVFLAGSASAEGVRRTFNKATGGVFFGKKKASGGA